MSDKTFWYGDDTGRLAAARGIYEGYCQYLFTDPARAKTQTIARIQSALAQAFSQGYGEEKDETRR